MQRLVFYKGTQVIFNMPKLTPKCSICFYVSCGGYCPDN